MSEARVLNIAPVRKSIRVNVGRAKAD